MRPSTFSDDQVVLLLGAPNSGALHIADILRTHPDVVMRHEPAIADFDARVPRFCAEADVDRYRDVATRYLQCLVQRATSNLPSAMRASGKPDRVAPNQPAPICGSFPIGQKSRASALRRQFGRNTTSSRGSSLPATDGSQRIVIESADHLGRIPLLTAAMPGMRVILTVRNPFGHAAAVLRTAGHDKLAASSPAKAWLETSRARSYGLSEQSLATMSSIERLTWHWAIRNELAIEALAEIPKSCVVIRRDVVVNPVKTARRLFACAGLVWDPQTFIRNRQAWTRSQHDEQGEDWPDRYPALGWMAELCLQAFDTVTRSLYGGTTHHVPSFGGHRFGWETALEPEDRRQILNVVRSTSLGSMFPDLQSWANLN